MTLFPWLENRASPAISPEPALALRLLDVGDLSAPESYTITFLAGGEFMVQSVTDEREIGRGQVGVPWRSGHFTLLLEGHEMGAGKTVTLTVLPLRQAAAHFRGNIAASLVRKTELVQVAATAISPQLARDMAAALAQEYTNFSRRQK